VNNCCILAMQKPAQPHEDSNQERGGFQAPNSVWEN